MTLLEPENLLSAGLLALVTSCSGRGSNERNLASVEGSGGGSTIAAGGVMAAGGAVGAGGSVAGAGGSVAGTGGAFAPPDGSASPSIGGKAIATPDAGSPDGAAPVDAAPQPDAEVPHTTGPGDWTAGDYPPDLSAPTYLEISGVDGQSGHVRQYKVHVPPSYQPDVPMPLVFCVHGLGQDALLFCVAGTDMPARSDEEGFILVMPNGYLNSWNAGTCCAAASNEQLDDVALFRAIFDEVGTHLNIDLDRVYATGLSNGGFMAYRLACEAADIFAAIAPGAGSIGTNDLAANWDLAGIGSLVGATNPTSDFTECTPSRPVSVLDVHGTSDAIVSYALQQPSLEIMAEHNGCSSSTVTARDPESSGDTECVSYEGCSAEIEVTGCTVTGGGHCWFGSADCGTGGGAIGLAFVGANSDTMMNTDAILDFFARHARR